MNPTAIFTPFDGRVEVRLFGRNRVNIDWNIDKVHEVGDLENQKALEQFAQVRHVALRAGVETVYAPNTTSCNAAVCRPEEFTTRLALENSSFTLVRGVKADGCVVPAKEGAWFSTADCPTIVAMNTYAGTTIAAHAGRDSLFGHGRLEGDEPARPRSTLVLNILAEFIEKRDEFINSEFNIFTTGGIGPRWYDHPINHPTYGKQNKALLREVTRLYGPSCLVGDPREVNLWLAEVIRQQFLRLMAIPSWHCSTDGIDTYDGRDEDGDWAWWSHRRATRHGESDGRNGILVIRRW